MKSTVLRSARQNPHSSTAPLACSPPPAQALYGTQVWSENVMLHRALQQRDATIQHQAHIIAALKNLAQGSSCPAAETVEGLV